MSSAAVWVNVSHDEYKAFLTIDPDAAGFKLTVETLKASLKERGVVFGIKEAVLKRIVETHQVRKVAPNILVAEGIKAEEGEPARVDYKFRKSLTPLELEGGRVNYREVATIIKVRKGQALAVKKAMKPSINGKTVRGREILVAPLRDVPVEAGENVFIREEGAFTFYHAAVDGALNFIGNTLAVSSSITIPYDLDFRAGNIRFSGGVTVKGDVKPDFTVQAGGNIKIDGSATGCELVARGSVVVGEGFVGKSRGFIRAGGHISVSYVENADLECRGNITVKNGITGSRLYCDGVITVENPGVRLVGSRLTAARGIIVRDVGSRVDARTCLVTGLHAANEREFQRIKAAMEAKEKEMAVIETRYGREALERKDLPDWASGEMKRDMEKWELFFLEVGESSEMLRKYEPYRYQPNAKIRIKGTLYPGIPLRIGPHTFEADREYHDVTAIYSKEAGKIILK